MTFGPYWNSYRYWELRRKIYEREFENLTIHIAKDVYMHIQHTHRSHIAPNEYKLQTFCLNWGINKKEEIKFKFLYFFWPFDCTCLVANCESQNRWASLNIWSNIAICVCAYGRFKFSICMPEFFLCMSLSSPLYRP